MKNVSAGELQAFLAQVELVPMLGEERDDIIGAALTQCQRRDPGPYIGVAHGSSVDIVHALEPARLVLDPADYFVVYAEARH